MIKIVKYSVKVDGITHIKEKRATMREDQRGVTKFFYDFAVVGIWKAGTKENPRGLMKPRFVIDFAFDKVEAEGIAEKARKKYMNVAIVPCQVDETRAIEERRRQKDKEYKAWVKKYK